MRSRPSHASGVKSGYRCQLSLAVPAVPGALIASQSSVVVVGCLCFAVFAELCM